MNNEETENKTVTVVTTNKQVVVPVQNVTVVNTSTSNTVQAPEQKNINNVGVTLQEHLNQNQSMMKNNNKKNIIILSCLGVLFVGLIVIIILKVSKPKNIDTNTTTTMDYYSYEITHASTTKKKVIYKSTTAVTKAKVQYGSAR